MITLKSINFNENQLNALKKGIEKPLPQLSEDELKNKLKVCNLQCGDYFKSYERDDIYFIYDKPSKLMKGRYFVILQSKTPEESEEVIEDYSLISLPENEKVEIIGQGTIEVTTINSVIENVVSATNPNKMFLKDIPTGTVFQTDFSNNLFVKDTQSNIIGNSIYCYNMEDIANANSIEEVPIWEFTFTTKVIPICTILDD